MRRNQPLLIIMLLSVIALMAVLLSLPVVAQDDDDDDNHHPVPLTPGVPLVTVTPTLDPTVCMTPLPLEMNQIIYIKPDVNIRAAPNGSSAIVWNTMFNNTNDVGTPVAEILRITATVVGGPICEGGYNWWQVSLPGNDGWVAEGRFDRAEGGYLFVVPGLDFDISCNPMYDLGVGQTAELAANVRLRTEPNTDSRTLTIAPAGATVEILSGPECVNRYRWWLVRVTVEGFPYSGWMAEGASDTYWMLPPNLPTWEDGTVCHPSPLEFSIGQQGTVNSVHNNEPHWLRASPGLIGAPLVLMVENVPFVIEGGPVCRDNLNWWQVRVLGSSPLIGWVAEGSRGVGYWLEPLDPDEYAR